MSNLDKEISDKIFLKDLKNEFLKSVNQSIIDFKIFLKTDDYENIRKTAHNLKGLSGIFGFEKGSELSKKVQISIDLKKYPETKLYVAELIEYFQKDVIPELNMEEK